jgi:polyphosphate kinase
VKGLSENIRVRSILGRFLEHSRLYVFGGAGDPIVFIGSADMMHRNLDRRVEALVLLTDPRHISDLRSLMSLGMSEGTSSWHLSGDGTWTRHSLDADGKPLLELQSTLIDNNTKRRRKARRTAISAPRR